MAELPTRPKGVSQETQMRIAEKKKEIIDDAMIDLILRMDSEEDKFATALDAIKYAIGRFSSMDYNKIADLQYQIDQRRTPRTP